MSQDDQARYDTGIHPVVNTPDTEAYIQHTFASICRARGWRPVWHSMHKRSTANRGCPDFIVGARGHTFWIEFKKPGEELSPDQAVFGMDLARNGLHMFTCHSWREAVDVIEHWKPDGL